MIYKKISKLNILHIILFYIIIYQYSHGLDFHDHGFYNFIGSLTIMLLFLIFFLPFNGLIYFIKKNNKIYLLVYLFSSIILLIILYFIFFVHYMNCDDWEKGLNNTIIENNLNKHACKITIPKICPFKLGKYFFDLSKWKNLKCEEMKVNTKFILFKYSKSKYINKNTQSIGIPLFSADNKTFKAFKDNSHILNKYFVSNFTFKIVDVDNKNLLKKIYKNKNPEIIIDYKNNKYGELKINITYDKRLSQDRKILEKNSSPYSSNIIVIYIDSVSRANSIRKLKKTLKFIEQFMNFNGGYNSKYPSEKYHSFQFFKYHSFTSYTRNNYLQIFYGNNFGNKENKNYIRITKYFKENGYITCFANDMCIEPTNTMHNMNIEEIADYEFLNCDPNMKSVHSHTKRCLYNKISTEYIYEYGNKFWRAYSKNRKFMILVTNDGHEGTLEVIKYIFAIYFIFFIIKCIF